MLRKIMKNVPLSARARRPRGCHHASATMILPTTHSVARGFWFPQLGVLQSEPEGHHDSRALLIGRKHVRPDCPKKKKHCHG
jgi:hypothetical protein